MNNNRILKENNKVSYGKDNNNGHVCAGNTFISVGSVLEIVIGVLLIVNALETAYILKKSGRLG